MAAVLIPWRPGCPHRTAALAHITGRYETAGHTVHLGEAPDGPWCKAAAVADALTKTTDDILVIADADVWTDGLDEALANVTDTRWAVPHDQVHRLSLAATSRILAGGPLRGECERRPYLGHPGGGIVVLTRRHWHTAPLDPRFIGWGQEDDSWAIALTRTIGPPWRGATPLWHLWHPTQDRLNTRFGSNASKALWRRYLTARRPDQIHALTEEARMLLETP